LSDAQPALRPTRSNARTIHAVIAIRTSSFLLPGAPG
jgi:hypothetical protein